MIRGTRSSGNGRSRTGPSASGPAASNVMPCCMKIASRRRPASASAGPELGERVRERGRELARLARGGEHLVVGLRHPPGILTRGRAIAKRRACRAGGASVHPYGPGGAPAPPNTFAACPPYAS